MGRGNVSISGSLEVGDVVNGEAFRYHVAKYAGNVREILVVLDYFLETYESSELFPQTSEFGITFCFNASCSFRMAWQKLTY
jgi:hypothetical protein